MRCLYFTSDLMFTSRVKPLAKEKGWDLIFPAFQAIDFSQAPELIIFDLEAMTGADIQEVMEKMRNHWDPMPPTVAYGPHVKEARLQGARDSGVETVWTRGQFNQQFSKLFDRPA